MAVDRPWPDNAKLAVSIVVNVEEGAEYSVSDGDKGPDAVDEMGVALREPIRNLANESNYKYGLQVGAPRILELLKRHSIPATFTSAAVALERSPELARAIVASGHEVCAHGYRWIQQHRFDEETERTFIRQAVESIERTTGQRPHGWLSRYLVSPNTRKLLVEAGFTYHMDDYSNDQPFWDQVGGKPIVILPYAIDTNDMKMWLAPAYTARQWAEYAIDTFDVLYREGAAATRMMSVGLHLRVIGRPGRIAALETVLDHMRSKPDVWFATRIDIARCWAAAVPFAKSR